MGKDEINGPGSVLHAMVWGILPPPPPNTPKGNCETNPPQEELTKGIGVFMRVRKTSHPKKYIALNNNPKKGQNFINLKNN